MVRTYKPKGKGKSVSVGTRAWLATHPDGKTRLPPDRQTRYQIVGKTPSGKLKIEIVVGKDGFMEGIGKSIMTIPEEDWKLRFRMNPTDSKQVVRKRKKTNGGVVMKGGTGGRGKSGRTEKVKQGKAATKIQRAVRRKLKKVKAVRKEQVAREEKFAPELRAELGKPQMRRWEGDEWIDKGTKALTESDLLDEIRQREGSVRQRNVPYVPRIPQTEWDESGEKPDPDALELERWIEKHKPKELREWEAERDKVKGPSLGGTGYLNKEGMRQWEKEHPEPRVRTNLPPQKDPKTGKVWWATITMSSDLESRARDAIKDRKMRAQPESTYYRDLLRVDRLQQQPTYDYNRAAQDWRERGGAN